jgi:hypothetical protein
MTTTEITQEQARQVLGLELGRNDSGAPTVRGYLVALLAELWREGEGFSGKRPFGNSSWEYDLYAPLIKAGLVKGKLDEDGYIDEFDDTRQADALIHAAITELGAPPALTMTPGGHQGPAQHTYTTACAGHHAPGPCPPSQPISIVGLSGGSEGSA